MHRLPGITEQSRQIPYGLRVAGHKARLRVFDAALKVLPTRQPRLFVGPGSIDRLADFIGTHEFERLLLVTDAGIVGLGLHEACLRRLESGGAEVVVYDGIEPNPTERQIEEGVAIAKREGCDAVLGFGGGSAMDAAKVIAAGATNDKSVADLEGPFRVRKQPLPMFAVPTTAGTGAEATFAAVVTNEADRRKYPVADQKLVPLGAALDPEITVGLPPPVTAATGMDALTHGIESYVCTRATEETQRAAKATIKLVFEHLRTAYSSGDDLAAREGMAMAAYEGGLSIATVGVGYVHGIAHKLGGLYHVPHGLANAVALPAVLEYSKDSCTGRLAELARLIGAGGNGSSSEAALADRFIGEVADLSREIGIPAKLEQIEEADVPAIATAAIDEAFELYAVPKYMRQSDAERVVRAISA